MMFNQITFSQKGLEKTSKAITSFSSESELKDRWQQALPMKRMEVANEVINRQTISTVSIP